MLIGFASDEGVRRNGGRIGAAEAPNAIRDYLYRFTSYDPGDKCDLAAVQMVDAGNLKVGADLESAQAQLGEIVGDLLKKGAVPVILGGGHETAFGHYLGYAKAKINTAILNIDAIISTCGRTPTAGIAAARSGKRWSINRIH